MRNILEVIAQTPTYFRFVGDESSIHSNSERVKNKLIVHFAEDDYAILQAITGEKFRFDFKDTGVYYPGTTAPAFPGEDIICWKTQDGKVGWQNSAPWMVDNCSKVEELESVDYVKGTLTTVQGNTYHTAPWITKEVVDDNLMLFKPHAKEHALDLKIVGNLVVAFSCHYYNVGDKEYNKRVNLYNKLGKTLVD